MYRHKIKVMRYAEVENDFGAVDEGYQFVADLFASVKVKKTDEVNRESGDTPVRELEIVVPFSRRAAEISTDDRIEYQGELYDVQAADDLMGDRSKITIQCEHHRLLVE